MDGLELPPIQFLRECFSYDPIEGVVRWRRRPDRHFVSPGRANNWNSQNVGGRGAQGAKGYWKFRVTYEGHTLRLLAHRVAFALMTDRTSFLDVDHENGDGSDNKWRNLREATASQNTRNQGSRPARGLPKGVFCVGHRFVAQATIGPRQTKYLGRFDTPAEAHAAYCAFVKPIHGAFFNPGEPVHSIFD